jgi:hypothetical protein
MSFSSILEKFLADLIARIGPAIIELIIRFLQGLDGDQTKVVAKGLADTASKALKNRTES